MVHRRKISTPEVRGNKRFLFSKFFLIFDFGHFLEKWLQSHLGPNSYEKNYTCGQLSNVYRYQKHVRLVRAFFLELLTSSIQQCVTKILILLEPDHPPCNQSY